MKIRVNALIAENMSTGASIPIPIIGGGASAEVIINEKGTATAQAMTPTVVRTFNLTKGTYLVYYRQLGVVNANVGISLKQNDVEHTAVNSLTDSNYSAQPNLCVPVIVNTDSVFTISLNSTVKFTDRAYTFTVLRFVDGGSGGGSNVTIEDNPDGGVDLTVDDQTRTLATESEVTDVKADLNELDRKVSYLGEDSPNFFDKNSDNLLNGYYSNSFQSNANYRMTHPIKLKGGVIYKYPQSSSLGGNTQVPYFTNEGGDITTSYSAGTLENGFVTIRFNIDVWARFNIGRVADLDAFMVCEADKYPDRYWDYGAFNIDKTVNAVSEVLTNDKIFNTNPLLNKIVAFDGDSISYGANDTQGRGWGSRIGNNNKLTWFNVSVTGGTIAVVPNKHNLCTYIDELHTNHPNLDYFIFDGGTNDADNLGENGIGEIATITYAGKEFPDFRGNYDTSTFCGGFETLIFKALQYYPNAKIGYIIAPKMGVWGGSSVNAMLLPKIREQYFEKAREICKKWGVPYIDLWQECTLNPCLLSQFNRDLTPEQNIALGHPYSSDAQHPNYIGYDMISPIIEKWMKTL